MTKTWGTRRDALDVRTGVIARKFQALAPLNPREVALVQSVGASPTTLHPIRTTLQLPESSGEVRYILSGWAAHVFQLRDGRRQICRIYLPGDALRHSPCLRAPQHHHHPLTPLLTLNGQSLHTAAREISEAPGLALALERAAALDQSLLISQIARLGRQTAFERMAHLFMELRYRCSLIDAVTNESIPFPLTQEELGDLLGLSVVHVNRTLQLMRRENIVHLKQTRLTFLKLDELLTVSEFQPPVL